MRSVHRLKLVSYNDAGEHFLERLDGSIVNLSKREMRDGEIAFVNPEVLQPNYEPVWSYNWYLLGQNLKARQWVESLSPDERRQILEKGGHE